MEIIERVKELLEPMAVKERYYVLDVTFGREGGKNVLHVTIDKKGGIAMDECASLNNELSEILDNGNIIEEEYLLEVSSPGLDRKLKNDAEFIWAIGKRIFVSTYAPLEGKKHFRGVLIGVGDGTIVLNEDSVSTEIKRGDIAGARLAPDIDWSKK